MSPDFLNIPGLVTSSHDDHGNHYRVQVRGTEDICLCPECSSLFFHKHGTQKQSYMDTPMHGKRVLLEVTRQRFQCQDCHKTFFEPLPGIDSKRQATKRLIKYIEERCVQETFVALAREVGVDEKTVRHVFDDYVAKKQVEEHYETPEILGIDELKIIGDYRAMLTNIDKLSVFDMLHSRKKVKLLEYFDSLPNKQNVHTLVMDMWNPYRQVGQKVFPGKLIVVDKFHVVRMANDGVERVRKKIRKTVDDRTRLKLKDEHRLLLKRKHTLSGEQTEKVQKWFDLFPILETAYETKERFYDIYTQPSREAAEHASDRWAANIPSEIEKDFRDLRVALNNWNQEIMNYYEQPVTNAYTESVNSITRFINRMGRGYSFEVLRARLLYNDQAVADSSTSVRKKVRRAKPPVDAFAFSLGRMMAETDQYEVTTSKYGPYIPTLVKLLEDGYFL